MDALKTFTQEQLIAMVLRLQEGQQRSLAELKVAELRTKSRETEVDRLNKAVAEKEDYITWLLKALTGPTSERRSWASLEAELQLWLEGMALKLPENPPPPDETVKDDEKKRRKKATSVGKNKARTWSAGDSHRLHCPGAGHGGRPH